MNPLPFSALDPRTYVVPAALPRRGRYVDNGWLSNFARGQAVIAYRSIRSNYVEAPYQAAKNPDAEVEFDGEVLPFHVLISRKASSNPSLAKKLGRPKRRGGLIDPRPDWEMVCIAAMATFEIQKYVPGTREHTEMTHHDGMLVEWNNWNDDRWGVPVTAPGRKATGRNCLGRLVRLKQEHPRYFPTAVDEASWPAFQADLVTALNRHT